MHPRPWYQKILSGLNSNCLTAYKGQESLTGREGEMVEDRSEKGRVTPHVSHLFHTVLPGDFCPNLHRGPDLHHQERNSHGDVQAS